MQVGPCRMSKLSIIMPVLDEGEGIVAALDALADLRARGTGVIVVDGGSRDATVQRARPRADRVILASRGRALQAAQARGQAAVPARARHHLGPALGEEGGAQHNNSDVAPAACLFLRCRSERTRAAIRL